ncbi:MAG: hypothetical protein HQL56_18450 [Magnetococcales bacterium]|nr:hypothetical protein [Magnetococcales bacterium]
MSKYTINYACGHGSTTKDIGGKVSERQGYVDWAERTMVCPDCYKAAKAAEDATADRVARLCLVPASDPVLSIEVTGQIEANKAALYAAGYRWSDSNEAGIMGTLSLKSPKRVLAKVVKLDSLDHGKTWMEEQLRILRDLGYKMEDGLNSIDRMWLVKIFEKKQEAGDAKAKAREELAEIEKTDPKPELSPLRKRIAELEKSTGAKWNGKIYGRSGGYNFYVNNVNYKATNAEVAEREQNIKDINAWDAKYAALIEAAK